MLKIVLAFFFTLSLWADGPVFKTGQSTEYYSGDDGTYQKGTTHSFSRDDVNGTVTDVASGLMWQDDAIGSTMNWTAAGTHCDGLTLSGYTNWRLPTIEELVSITDKSIASPGPVIFSAFQNTAASIYWSSTADASSTSFAWGMNFGNGDDYANGNKTNSYYVRCVRETDAYVSPVSSYTRDNSNDTVYDSDTNLTWMDDANVSSQTKTWIAAIDYCEALDFAGVQDWRLPNFNELYMIADRTTYNPAIDATFESTAASVYWSSTTVASNTSYEWGVSFYYGNDAMFGKTGSHYVRCVRDGQIIVNLASSKGVSPAVITYLLH